MIDVKKLMASFLALAAVGAFVAFLISDPNFYRGTVGANFLTAQPNPVSANAFLASVEATPLALRENLGGGSPNLTAVAAQNVAQVILALNPNGPQQLADGSTGFIVPTTTLLTAYLTMESPGFSLADLWTSPSSETVAPATSTGVAANQSYANAFHAIMSNTLADPGFVARAQAAATSPDGTPFFSTAAATFGSASQQLKALPVPAPFVAFDKNFLAYLDDQQTALALIAANNDPLKSMLVLNSGPQVQQQITNDYVDAINQYQALNLPSLLAVSQPPRNSWLDNTLAFANRLAANFSIPTAFAATAPPGGGGLGGATPEDNCGKNFVSGLKGLVDNVSGLFSAATAATNVPVTESNLEQLDATILKDNAATFGILSYECQQAALAQKTKSNESDMMTQVEANTIRNNGNPRVIGDFAQYQQDAANRAGALAYKNVSAQICPQYQPAVDALVFNPANTSLDTTNGQSTDLNSDVIGTSSTTGLNGGNSNTTSTFGSSQVNGTGSQCPLPDSNPSIFSGGGATSTDDMSVFLTETADPNGSLYGTILSAHDTIDSQMSDAATAAQTESIANQGLKSQVTCTDYYTDANGYHFCDQTRVTGPGSIYSSQIQATLSSQIGGALNSSNPAQMDTLLADSLWTQMQKNPDQGIAVLIPQSGDSLASVCNSLAPPGTNSGQNPAFLACNNAMGKIITDYNKYVQLANTVGSIVNTFSQLQNGL